MTPAIEIRECTTLEEFAACVDLQRSVFALPEVELSPVRHLVVTRNAGGFVLGAFAEGVMIGFVLSVPAFLRGEKAFYSHMTAVRSDFQSRGVGGLLKWGQRERALSAGIRYIKWTFEPWKARNAYFNLEKLGAEMREYQRDFYGVDHTTAGPGFGLASDRLIAEWDLKSAKTEALASGKRFDVEAEPRTRIEAPHDWSRLVDSNPQEAMRVQLRLRADFESAFARGLVARGFRRDPERPEYLLY